MDEVISSTAKTFLWMSMKEVCAYLMNGQNGVKLGRLIFLLFRFRCSGVFQRQEVGVEIKLLSGMVYCPHFVVEATVTQLESCLLFSTHVFY